MKRIFIYNGKDLLSPIVTLVEIVSHLLFIILILSYLSWPIITKPLNKKKNSELFKRLLSRKILNPKDNVLSLPDIKYFSQIYEEIVTFEKQIGIDTKETLQKLRKYFNISQDLERKVHSKLVATIIQFFFLAIFIFTYGLILSRFFPLISEKLYFILSYNLISIVILSFINLYIEKYMFSRLWLFLKYMILLEIRLGVRMSIQKTFQDLPSQVLEVKLDKEADVLRQNLIELIAIYRQEGRSIINEIQTIFQELSAHLSHRVDYFITINKSLKMIGLALFFLPSLFYFNLIIVQSSLGQIF